MKVNQEDVQHRILVAARAEFAEFGLAGARVDRIAREGHASKERLYAYFADKSALFQAVLDLNGREFFEAVPLDPNDIPAFVGAVFDHSFTSPEHIRMLTWARLDGIDFNGPAGESAPEGKLDALREGQRRGTVDPAWDVRELLPLLFAVGLAASQSPDPAARNMTGTARDSQRRAAVEAARRLVTPLRP